MPDQGGKPLSARLVAMLSYEMWRESRRAAESDGRSHAGWVRRAIGEKLARESDPRSQSDLLEG